MATRATELQRPPEAGELRPFRFPRFAAHELRNGLRIYLAPYDRGPLIEQLLIYPGGAQHDPVDGAGLACLTASLLDEGTEEHTAMELAARIEGLGGSLSTQADWDSLSASVGLLSEHLQEGLRLLSEISGSAVFPEEEFDRQHAQHLAALRRRLAQPSSLANDALARAVYGDRTYGNPTLGTAETVTRLQRSDVIDFGRDHLTPEGTSLVLVGALDVDTSMEAIEEAFDGWSGRRGPSPPEIETLPLDGVRIHLIDRPDSPQTELRLGHAGIARRHPHFAGLQVLNSLLGGKFSSRLNLNLRERLGITYGVSSSLAQRLGPGPFVVAASVDTAATGTAVREILRELKRLQNELASRKELEDTKGYLLGVFPYSLQRIAGLAYRLAEIATFDLPHDYFDHYPEEIRAVGVRDLQNLARHHLDPDNIAVIAVGPRVQLEEQLAPFGAMEFSLAPTPDASLESST